MSLLKHKKSNPAWPMPGRVCARQNEQFSKSNFLAARLGEGRGGVSGQNAPQANVGATADTDVHHGWLS
jgi:hypothetical protein